MRLSKNPERVILVILSALILLYVNFSKMQKLDFFDSLIRNVHRNPIFLSEHLGKHCALEDVGISQVS